jgi:hypothetical protein
MEARLDPLSPWERVGVRASNVMFWSIYPLSLSLFLRERGTFAKYSGIVITFGSAPALLML